MMAFQRVVPDRFAYIEAVHAVASLARVMLASALKLARTWTVVLVLTLAWPVAAHAFFVPSEVPVAAGSEWIYDSNLGQAKVRLVSREDAGSDVSHYVWDMEVGGLYFRETLELRLDRLGVETRTFGAFGVWEQHFEFESPELVFELPLEVGSRWQWAGRVAFGDRSAPAVTEGEVLAREEVSVPAGTFQAFHIRLYRTDELGTRQEIDLWFDPGVGPIRAVGDLRWQGLIGYVQDLVGMNRFEVELVEYRLRRD